RSSLDRDIPPPRQQPPEERHVQQSLRSRKPHRRPVPPIHHHLASRRNRRPKSAYRKPVFEKALRQQRKRISIYRPHSRNADRGPQQRDAYEFSDLLRRMRRETTLEYGVRDQG